MALKNNIDQAAFDALPDALKAEYKAKGDGTYDLQHDGVTKLKESLDRKDATLREKDQQITELQRQAEAWKDLDPAKAREALAKAAEIEQGKLVDKGDYDRALAAERDKNQRDLKALQDRFDAERKFTESQLVDGVLRRVLTSGRTADGKPMPKVRPGLVDGAEALIRATFAPKVIEAGDRRVAMVRVNGRDVELGDFLAGEWLTSDSAKDWTEAPDSAGGHDGKGQPGQPATAKRTVTQAEAGGSIEAIASGEAVVSG